MEHTGVRSLSSCFVLFGIIHRLTTTHEVITSIAREVVADFAADGCSYLELRTTPKVCVMNRRGDRKTFMKFRP